MPTSEHNPPQPKTVLPYVLSKRLSAALATVPRDLMPLAGHVLEHLVVHATDCPDCGGTGVWGMVEGCEIPLHCPRCLGLAKILPVPSKELPV